MHNFTSHSIQSACLWVSHSSLLRSVNLCFPEVNNTEVQRFSVMTNIEQQITFMNERQMKTIHLIFINQFALISCSLLIQIN